MTFDVMHEIMINRYWYNDNPDGCHDDVMMNSNDDDMMMITTILVIIAMMTMHDYKWIVFYMNRKSLALKWDDVATRI